MANETDEPREAGGNLVTQHFGVLEWLCVHPGELLDEPNRISLI